MTMLHVDPDERSLRGWLCHRWLTYELAPASDVGGLGLNRWSPCGLELGTSAPDKHQAAHLQ
jgi:hypothetical protein